MKFPKTWISKSISESQKIAQELCALFKAGDVILLEGNLGSGKTFLVKQICKNWHVREEVTSPTFTIIQNYMGDVAVNHMDLYRIEQIEELDQIGWEDMVYSDAITFIEWPQMVEPLLKSFYKININLVGGQREITLNKLNG